MAYSSWSVIAGETPTATKWNLLGSNDADFDSRLTQLLADKTLAAASDGSTVTFNLATRLLWEVTIAGNRTLALSNVVAGRPFLIVIKQDGTGSRTVTWWSGIDWANGNEPLLTTTAGKADAFMFIPKPGSTTTFYGIPVAFEM